METFLWDMITSAINDGFSKTCFTFNLLICPPEALSWSPIHFVTALKVALQRLTRIFMSLDDGRKAVSRWICLM